MKKSNAAALPFECDTCPRSFTSAKELMEHYEDKHPEMIEKMIMPI